MALVSRIVKKVSSSLHTPALRGSPLLQQAWLHRKTQEHGQIEEVQVPLDRRGTDITSDCYLNKGTGFSSRERDRLGLRGLVPPAQFTIEQQMERVYHALHSAGGTTQEAKEAGKKEDAIAKHVFLIGLQDRNETLFHRLLINHITELAPLIYTPTVGLAVQNAGLLFRRPRGLYFTLEDKGDMQAMIHNWPSKSVDVVVMTDGSRILGLGDLGVQGMGIPIGKLSLYTAGGGIHPRRCLPVMIDVGTNNETLLKNPYYMGLRRRRAEGTEYFEIIDEVMEAITSRFPEALVQFEDFKSPFAEALLTRYRQDYRMFNDDIQGTGAVVVGGLMAAFRNAGGPLAESRIVCVGAGSAGIGVCNAVADAFVEMGLPREQALSRFWLVDDKGLITRNRKQLIPQHIDFARVDEASRKLEGASVADVVRHVKPTVILGLAGAPLRLFSEEAIRAMYANVKKPIIFAMSNPTHLSECTAEQAYTWTEGNAIFASGSPFDPVTIGNRTYFPSQANNVFIFPGVGLGVVATRALRVTDKMMFQAAQALSEFVTDKDVAEGRVFPKIADIRAVSHRIAVAVAKCAESEGLATIYPPDGDWNKFIDSHMWSPKYPTLSRPNHSTASH